MAYLASGSRVTIQYSGTDYILQWSATPVDQKLANAALGQPFTILTSSVQTPSWLSTAVLTAAITDQYPYLLTVTVQTQTDFADPSDLANLIAGLLYQQIGIYPSQISVQSVNNVGTGNPSQTAPTASVDLGATAGNLSRLLSGLTNPTTLLVIVVVVIGGIVLLAVKSPKTVKMFL